jgi:hypothetical protein
VKALSRQLDLALDADTFDAAPAASEDVTIDTLLATQAGIVPAASIDA